MEKRTALLEAIAAAGLLALIALAAWAYATLPDSIATSFRSDGQVSYGSKLTVFLLPLIGVFAYAVSSFAQATRRPRINFPPIRITGENRDRIYAIVREMTLATKAVICVGFAGIEWQLIRSARGTLSPGFTPTILAMTGAILLLTCGYFVRLRRAA